MGLFTPKYPKSDTPGVTSTPPPRARRSSRSNYTYGSGSTTSTGLTTSQIRSLGSQPGVTVDIRGNTAKVTVDEWDTKASIVSQVFTKQPDGTWTSA